MPVQRCYITPSADKPRRPLPLLRCCRPAAALVSTALRTSLICHHPHRSVHLYIQPPRRISPVLTFRSRRRRHWLRRSRPHVAARIRAVLRFHTRHCCMGRRTRDPGIVSRLQCPHSCSPRRSTSRSGPQPDRFVHRRPSHGQACCPHQLPSQDVWPRRGLSHSRHRHSQLQLVPPSITILYARDQRVPSYPMPCRAYWWLHNLYTMCCNRVKIFTPYQNNRSSSSPCRPPAFIGRG